MKYTLISNRFDTVLHYWYYRGQKSFLCGLESLHVRSGFAGILHCSGIHLYVLRREFSLDASRGCLRQHIMRLKFIYIAECMNSLDCKHVDRCMFRIEIWRCLLFSCLLCSACAKLAAALEAVYPLAPTTIWSLYHPRRCSPHASCAVT